MEIEFTLNDPDELFYRNDYLKPAPETEFVNI